MLSIKHKTGNKTLNDQTKNNIDLYYETYFFTKHELILWDGRIIRLI